MQAQALVKILDKQLNQIATEKVTLPLNLRVFNHSLKEKYSNYGFQVLESVKGFYFVNSTLSEVNRVFKAVNKLSLIYQLSMTQEMLNELLEDKHIAPKSEYSHTNAVKLIHALHYPSVKSSAVCFPLGKSCHNGVITLYAKRGIIRNKEIINA